MINEFFKIFFESYGDSVLLIKKEDFTIVDFNKKAMVLYNIPAVQRDTIIGKPFTSFKLSEFSFLKPEEINTIFLEIKSKGKWSVILPTKTVNGVPFTAKTTVSIINKDNVDYLLVVTEKIADSIGVNESDKVLLAKESIRAKLAEEANVLLEQEIEKHKITQEEYKKSQEFVNSMINSSLDVILASNNENIITHVSPSAAFLFGYSIEEFNKIKAVDLYKNEEEFNLVNKQVIKNGYFIGEVTNKKKDGTIFSTYLSASQITNKDGDIIGLMGVSRDIEEIKKIEQEIVNSEKRYRELFENLSDAILIIDEKSNIIDINQAGKELFEIDGQQNVKFHEFIAEENIEYAKEVAKELKSKGYIKGVELEIITKKGNRKHIEVSRNAFFEKGVYQGSKDIIRDISEKKISQETLIKSLKEKEVLLKEVHHRVKNNLQVISSILNLQSSYVKDQNTLDILRESQNRIKSMSFIHESLYRSDDFSFVNFSNYIESLSSNLVQSYILEYDNVELELNLGDYNLNLDQAIPCGLIINELVSNSIKYAFPDNKKGIIKVELTKTDNQLTLSVADDGVGLPENFDVENTDTLGLQLVYTLVNQLDGDIKVINNNGTKILFNFTIQ